MPFLVFIDTNIYLDFYRYRNDVSLSLLRRLDTNHDRIITTAEVEMEYKKNRQRVILEALQTIRPQNPTQPNIPSFLKESTYNKTSARLANESKALVSRLAARTERLLQSPGRYDPVYRILQRLFNAKATCHLTRGSKMRQQIREKAQKRCMLGYPPRKPNDTSIGDAINWEWIIYCAKQCQDDIVVISRDSDYGPLHKDTYYLNDWLLQEFKERVSRKRSITLTGRLAEGFKIAGITVPEEEEQAEEWFLQALRQAATQSRSLDDYRTTFSHMTDFLPQLKLSDDLLSALSRLSTRHLLDDEPDRPDHSDRPPDGGSGQT